MKKRVPKTWTSSAGKTYETHKNRRAGNSTCIRCCLDGINKGRTAEEEKDCGEAPYCCERYYLTPAKS